MLKFLKIFPFIIAACTLSAQSEGNMRDLVNIGDGTYMVVFPFESHRQYAEFSYNKQVLANAYKEMTDLKAQVEAEKDKAKKEELAVLLLQKTEVFEANNSAMVKGYNFTSGRAYIDLFLKTYICTPLSDEEFSILRFADGTPIDPLKIVQNGKQQFYRTIAVEGFQNNQDFQGILAFIMARRMEISKLREQVAEQIDMDKVGELTTQIAGLEKQLNEKFGVLKEKFGLEANSRYMVEIEKARLLLKLTPEEIIQMQNQKNSQPK